MAFRCRCLALASLAALAPRAAAVCDDVSPVNKCEADYSAFFGNIIPTQRCPAWETLVTCVNTWIATCNDTKITKSYVDDVIAKKNGLCAAGGVCVGNAAFCVPTTTTFTPWDSSASSNSGNSSQSLNSNSLHAGSSGSAVSGWGASSASTQSGSSGSFLEMWQWTLLMSLCCCCCIAGVLGMLLGKKPKKGAKKKAAPKRAPTPAPAPAPLLVPEVTPLLEMPVAISTTPSYTTAVPSYSYAQPTYVQAAPSYAQPTYVQGAGYAGYPAGYAYPAGAAGTIV